MRMRITVEGRAYDVEVELLDDAGGTAVAAVPAPAVPTQASHAPPPRPSAPVSPGPSAAGDLPSPLAGNVVRVAVKPGDAVKAGDTVLILEAMKMESAVTAPGDGTVAEVLVNAGDAVKSGQTLVTFA